MGFTRVTQQCSTRITSMPPWLGVYDAMGFAGRCAHCKCEMRGVVRCVYVVKRAEMFTAKKQVPAWNVL